MFEKIENDFNKNLLISCGIHLGLLALALLGGKLVSKVFKNNDVEIIRAAVRVDVVGMPKFTVQELKVMQRDAIPTPEPEVAKGATEESKPVQDTPDVVKKDDLVIQEKGQVVKKSSFLNVLNEYSNKKVTKKEVAKGEKKGVGNKNLDSLIIEGNRLSKGTALVGDFSDEAGSEFAQYVQTLPDLIRPLFRLPSYLKEKDLRCRIRVFLSQDGKVLKAEVHESSGIEDFDVRARKAIEDAAPFPKPSQAVGVRLASSGIILGFPI